MNVFIVAVCVNLIAIVNAVDDIYLGTILKILKVRRSGSSKFDKTNDLVDTIPIIPGFYLQKPSDISKALFRNPTTWPNSAYDIFSNEDTRKNKTKIQDISTTSNEEYLKAKILKAVKNLNKYRESQKHKKDKTEKPKPYIDSDSAQKVSIEKLLNQQVANGITNTNNYQGRDKYSTFNTDKTGEKALVEKLLSQILKEIKTNNRYEESLKYPAQKAKDIHYRYKKKQDWETGSKNVKKLGELLKNLLNINNNNYRVIERYDTTEERSQNNDEDNRDLLENILNVIQNNNRERGTQIHRQHPSLILAEIWSPKILRSGPLSRNVQDFLYGRPNSSAFHNNDRRSENRKKEKTNSMEAFDDDYDNSDTEVRRHTRRNNNPDDSNASNKDSSDESEMEKNPGNPFTIHKNKYKQNWPNNHFMDGDHMNINPFGPQFGSLGPTGPELFFGRKWWYYNQDDFKPMG